ncbi:MAG: FKBP-type peptidyl-prolyl cis-trans isomerase [Candidatus Micrarchaeia archaeon]
MVLKDGDFVEIEYSAWNAADNSLVLSTDAEKAKSAGIFDEKARYGPVLVVIGSNTIIRGLERELHSMSPGETKRFTFKPEEAFGERNENLVMVLPLSEFRKRDINPYPGMNVDIDNISAVVKSVNSGRVIVDANHPFAGRELIYEVKVVKVLTDPNEKINALADMYSLKPSRIELGNQNVSVEFGSEVSKDANYFVNKASLVAAIFNYFKDINEVKVEESYKRPGEKGVAKSSREEEEKKESKN